MAAINSGVPGSMALALLSTAAWAAVGVSIPVIVYSDGDSEVKMSGELRRPRRLELHLCAAFRANGYTRNGGDHYDRGCCCFFPPLFFVSVRWFLFCACACAGTVMSLSAYNISLPYCYLCFIWCVLCVFALVLQVLPHMHIKTCLSLRAQLLYRSN